MTFLFDFDGTLVDSMPVYAKMIYDLLDECGIHYTPDILKITTPLGHAGTAKLMVEMGAERTAEELLAQLHSRALEDYTWHIGEKPGVGAALRRLKAAGHSLNVLTASPHVCLDPCLQRLGLWDLFDNVWSCDDFGTTKSDPEIYRMAAARLGCAAEDVVFLDDNYNADKTAGDAGMTVWGVYDESSADMEADIRAVTHRYIRSFDELGK